MINKKKFKLYVKNVLYSSKVFMKIYSKYTKRVRNKYYWKLYRLPLFEIKRLFRRWGIASKEYKQIREYKNMHKGERCFIVATGPSLQVEDVTLLKDEITFGMNSLCKLFEKLEWESTYFVMEDYGTFCELFPYLKEMNNTTFFYGDIWFKKRQIRQMKCKTQKFPRYYEDHAYESDDLHTDFSLDIYDRVYEAYTVTAVALQIAAYMGFSNIYLLGVDCDYSSEKREDCYMPGLEHGGEYKERIYMEKKMICAYNAVKKRLENSETKVFNASRGGKLEVFPRVDFDLIIGEKRAK